MARMSKLHRCAWAESDPLLRDYHDQEWGVPEYDSRALWELLMLEGFQAGLAWITVLRKREAFRKAFRGFEPKKVARFGEPDIARLLGDPGLFAPAPRSRRRSRAPGFTRRWKAAGEGFSAFAWKLAGGKPIKNKTGCSTCEDCSLGGDLSRAQEAWLQVCRSRDRLCLDAGVGDGQRSRAALLPAQTLETTA